MLDTNLVMEAEKKLVAAFNENDSFMVDELYHESLLFVNAQGHTLTKAMDLDNLRSGVMRIISYESEDQTINVIDDVAVVAMTVKLGATMAGNALNGTFRMMRVWKKVGKSLQVIAISGVKKA